jgi:hypothetical protein
MTVCKKCNELYLCHGCLRYCCSFRAPVSKVYVTSFYALNCVITHTWFQLLTDCIYINVPFVSPLGCLLLFQCPLCLCCVALAFVPFGWCRYDYVSRPVVYHCALVFSGLVPCMYYGSRPLYLFMVLLTLLFGFQPCVLSTYLFGLCPVNKNPYYAFLHLSPDPSHNVALYLFRQDTRNGSIRSFSLFANL